MSLLDVFFFFDVVGIIFLATRATNDDAADGVDEAVLRRFPLDDMDADCYQGRII